MSSIDTRVVEAKFNNAQFGKGVSDTIGSLDKLKAGLKLDGAAAGLEGVNAAAKGFDASAMEGGVGRISASFSALQAVAFGALANIGAKISQTAMQMGKEFTVQPILDGFSEYELKMGSIQTILANTAKDGTNLQQVNTALDQLNTYADKTIYSFGDMTKNIGLFTNAGIHLSDATSMIKGFSNEAAASGTNAEGAAGAAYQLSQALSAGTIRLMDWRSLQNVGMGNANMKNGIIDIATAMGAFKKAGISAKDVQKDFNGSLEKGWLSSDVMSTYLKIQAGDMDAAKMKTLGLTDAQIKSFQATQKMSEEAATKVRTFSQLTGTLKEAVGSGWTDTFSILIGNFDEATNLFTGINNVLSGIVGNSANARNKMLQDWKDAGGRTALLDGLKSTMQILGAVLKSVSAAFRAIFPAKTGQQLADTTKSFAAFMQDLIPAPATIEKLTRTFEGVFAILHIGWVIVKGLATFFFDLFAGVEEGNKGILDTTATIGDFFVGLDKAITAGGGVTKFFNTLKDLLFIIINPLKNLGAVIGNAFSGLGDVTVYAGQIGVFITSLLSFGSAADDTGKKASSAADTIKAVFGGLIGIASNVASTVKKFAESIINAFSKINFDDLMKGLQTLDFAAISAGLFGVIKALKGFNLFGGKSGAGGLISGIKESLEGLNGTLKSMQNDNNASALLKLAGAIALLALAVMLLASIDPASLTAASIALAVLFVELTKGMQAFNKAVGIMGAAKLNLLVPALIGIAIAVLLLVAAVKILTLLGWDALAKGLLGLGIMLAMLSASVRIMAANNKRMLSTGLGLMAIAIAVDMLVAAVWFFSNMDWASMAKGLAGVGAILLELALFTRFAKAGAGAVAQGIAIAMLAGAILVLAQAVKQMASLSWADMAKGLTGLGLALIMMGAAMKFIPASSILQALAISKIAGALSQFADVFMRMAALSWSEVIRGMMAFAVTFGMVILAIKAVEKVNFGQLAGLSLVTGALEQMSNALKNLGDMSWEQIVHGLTGLVATIGVLVIALKALEKVPANAGIALGIVAGSLALLAPALATMGNIPIAGIVGALVLLAGVFVIIGVSANLLAGSVPVLIGLGIAIGLLGVAIALAGAGTLAFALGFTMLGAAAAVGTAGIVAALSAIIGLIPMVLQQVGLGLVALANVIATSAPAFIGAMTAILTALLQSVINILPQLAILIMELVTLILTILRNAVPQMIATGFVILIAFLQGIANNIGAVVVAGANIIINFLNGLASRMGAMVTAAVNVIVAFVNGIAANLPRIIQAGINLIIAFMNGIGDGVRNNGGRMADAAWNMASGIVEGVAKGLASMGGKILDALLGIVKGAWNGALKFLGIKSPSRKGIWMGQMVAIGLTNGLDDNAHLPAKAAAGMASGVLDAMGKNLSGLGDMIDAGMDDLNPVITPVLDLSNIQRDSSQINQMLANTTPISVATPYTRATSAQVGYDQNQIAALEAAVQAGGNQVTFVQNNNSPKALAAGEIYRNTNSQLARAKEALKT